jgi:hypothetical protein
VGEQAFSSIKVVAWLFGDHSFQVWKRRSCVTHEDCADTATVEGVKGVGAGRYGLFKGGSSLGQMAILHIEVAKFFVVSRRGIVAHQEFELADSPPPREDPEGAAQQLDVRGGFRHEIDESSDRAEEEDHKDPVGLGAAADEVNDRHTLEDEPPGIQKMTEISHGGNYPCVHYRS